MKFFPLAALLVLSLNAFAQEQNDEGRPDFATAKENTLVHIDEGISHMQEHKNCVNAATDHDGLKACHMKHKEERKARKEKMKEFRKGKKG